jgi:hypothetical protein
MDMDAAEGWKLKLVKELEGGELELRRDQGMGMN